MITQNRGTIAFAVCGSFCTLEAALQSARALTAQGWQLLPVMSFAARQDTRFGTGNYWKEQLEAAARYWTRCRRWSRWAPAKWRRHWW